MRVEVAGRRVELPDGLRARVVAHLGRIAARCLGSDATAARSHAAVTFARGRSFVSCDIDLRDEAGLLLHGEGEGTDPTGAFDDAAEHIARRLRRYRRRFGGPDRSLAAPDCPGSARHYLLRREEDRDPGPEALRPRPYATVVGENRAAIPTLSVGEAVMRLDLCDRPLLMFRNSLSGGINVVYRREDGLVGWLDPEECDGTD